VSTTMAPLRRSRWCEKLCVPSDRMPAFAEFFEATLERLGSSVSDAKLDRVLRRWKARTAKEARAVCEVEAYLATADCVNMMRAAAAEACAAAGDGGRDVAWYERAVRRRAAFRSAKRFGSRRARS
jgi:hypothetical protein